MLFCFPLIRKNSGVHVGATVPFFFSLKFTGSLNEVSLKTAPPTESRPHFHPSKSELYVTLQSVESITSKTVPTIGMLIRALSENWHLNKIQIFSKWALCWGQLFGRFVSPYVSVSAANTCKDCSMPNAPPLASCSF